MSRSKVSTYSDGKYLNLVRRGFSAAKHALRPLVGRVVADQVFAMVVPLFELQMLQSTATARGEVQGEDSFAVRRGLTSR